MPTFGLTTEGFVPMTLEDVRDQINSKIWSTISPTLDLSNSSLEGQLIGIVAEAITKLWELGESINSSQDPDKASGAALDALGLLTGAVRRGAAASTVVALFTGTPGTLIPEGAGVRVTGGTRFDTDDDATLVVVDSWVTLTAYAVGDIVTRNSEVYQCHTAGTSGTGPTVAYRDPDPDTVIETDGSVVWAWLGSGTSVIEVPATCTETGPVVANALTLDEIATPIGGVEDVVNLSDAKIGHNQMTDAEFRAFRQSELAQPGTSPADAIRAALLALEDVIAATVFVNNTDATDGDGLPPHSIEALVRGGEDQVIWDTLFANVAAGIATYGDEDGFSVDSQGVSQAMYFSRPDQIPIYVTLTLVKDPLTYPADGDDQVKAAIVAYGDAQQTGKDVVASRIAAAVFQIAGVLDVSPVFIGTTPTPVTSTTIPISLRQLATFDASQISVTTSDGTP